MAKKKTIAIDIDDVLAHSAEGFAAFSNKQWNANITADDYVEEWATTWKVPLEEAIARAKVFHESGAVGRYTHFESALPVLTELGRTYNLVAITSRRIVLQPETDRWLNQHFPGLIGAIHYAGIWDDDQSSGTQQRLKSTKLAICQNIGADYLIDDQIKHCLSAAGAGIRALLFGNYRWNQLIDLPKNVTRVADWTVVQEYFNA